MRNSYRSTRMGEPCVPAPIRDPQPDQRIVVGPLGRPRRWIPPLLAAPRRGERLAPLWPTPPSPGTVQRRHVIEVGGGHAINMYKCARGCSPLPSHFPVASPLQNKSGPLGGVVPKGPRLHAIPAGIPAPRCSRREILLK